MKLFNKEKRIKYLGFNDFWFAVISILVLSIVTNYLFSNYSEGTPFFEIVINWVISLFFTLCNWFFMRNVIIYLRKKYTSFQDTLKRIMIVFFFIIISVPLIDYIGSMIIGSFFNDFHYYITERFKVLLPIVIISVMIHAIYEAIYYHTMLKKIIREEEQTKQVMVQAQLDALRNQAQPHFFFNTLNTLRDIIDQNSKDEAKEFVDKLSGVYRFILESGNVNLISLRDELKFSQAYIHIQSERFGDNLQVQWNIPEAILNKMMVPMSMQLLLENAIKHNVVSRSKPLTVEVFIKEDHVCVTNKMQAKSTKLPSTKLGLKNIEKRYALISNQPIKIKNDGEFFTVRLPLLNMSDQKQ
ncbi:histidine kinase [uncultured Dokdonia sp.]|uniref:sensor histidine kinase n=1 Tax=uncultured Dokdonia sp. TaxID=575653 RepID=UPI002625642A|nr:histidine kinase [uncultured Dokdonia sp.]